MDLMELFKGVVITCLMIYVAWIILGPILKNIKLPEMKKKQKYIEAELVTVKGEKDEMQTR